MAADQADTASWIILDHACRQCAGRLLASADGARIRCSSCGASADGGPEALCACGADLGAAKVRLRCHRRRPTAECPAEVIIIEAPGALTAAAADVSYFDIAGVPRRFFRCATYRATLSPEACASRFRAMQKHSLQGGGWTTACAGCAIGAAHAGVRAEKYSAAYGASICPRDRSWTPRLVGNRLGISSYNRQREFLTGENRRGTPVTFRLDPRRLGVIVWPGSRYERALQVREDLTADTIEIVLQCLRIVPAPIAFCVASADTPATTISALAGLAIDDVPPYSSNARLITDSSRRPPILI